MAKRKLIGLIIANPEAAYQQRVLDGLTAQCEKYGYDIAVFSPLVQSCHFIREYLDGEVNIFELMNFDRLDGVIVATISLSASQVEWINDMICKKLEEECKKPVVALDLPLGDYHLAETDDRSAFSLITRHILDEHKCRRIYFLPGIEGLLVTNERIAGCRDEMERRGLTLDEKDIFYGDFWFTGGEALADRIASGELEMPEAVICGNDHMAIGLANRLISHGIKVPEQVIVTGYDATSEAAINTPAITTYIPDISKTMAEAVNYIRSIIEPGADIIPAVNTEENGIRLCDSCGCSKDLLYVKSRLNDSLLNSAFFYCCDYNMKFVDMGRLLDSFMFELLTGSNSMEDFFHRIASTTYLLSPYSEYYLCLCEDWLNTDVDLKKGYADSMIEAVYTRTSDGYLYSSAEAEIMFDSKEMLPALNSESEEPSIFYFVPMHFGDTALGYSVLRCPLSQERKIGIVFHNWIRNINNVLQMMRVQNRLTVFSQRDAMTGLYNRRGMEECIEKLLANAAPSDSLMVFVIDMDGLKYINDNFGHGEGDFGINAVASAVRRICKNTEICVRAGGDEFYIIGVGDYSLTDCIVRIQQFILAIADESKAANKPYEISASIGYCCERISGGISLNDAIALADSRMYESKAARKKQRKN